MLILGSQSPRRKELLAGLDIPFQTVSIDCDERFPEYLQAGDIPLYLAKLKASAYGKPQPGDILITADTIVWLKSRMLGKPHDDNQARQMLHALSGQTHQVFTGVALTSVDKQIAFVASTDVTFRCLTDEEINYYVEKYKPLDKAGAYGIQEWIGYIGITSINGSYFNVMGLPVQRLADALYNHFFTSSSKALKEK